MWCPHCHYPADNSGAAARQEWSGGETRVERRRDKSGAAARQESGGGESGQKRTAAVRLTERDINKSCTSRAADSAVGKRAAARAHGPCCALWRRPETDLRGSRKAWSRKMMQGRRRARNAALARSSARGWGWGLVLCACTAPLQCQSCSASRSSMCSHKWPWQQQLQQLKALQSWCHPAQRE
jgi:hypothetical protein